MAGFTVGGKAWMVGSLPAAPEVSLHSAAAGDAGANELAGGGYGRLTGVLAAPTGTGPVQRQLTVAAAHNVPAGATVAEVGLWTPDGATFLASFAVTPESYAGAGTYQVDPSTVGIT